MAAGEAQELIRVGGLLQSALPAPIKRVERVWFLCNRVAPVRVLGLHLLTWNLFSCPADNVPDKRGRLFLATCQA
ncbi:hypothetical protein, partial [Actinoplanes couchii]|uniref:hypothetical protein n=1 Tax=Actinoplanes couchii TaxID=403638 RepID=UPI0031E29A5B